MQMIRMSTKRSKQDKAMYRLTDFVFCYLVLCPDYPIHTGTTTDMFKKKYALFIWRCHVPKEYFYFYSCAIFFKASKTGRKDTVHLFVELIFLFFRSIITNIRIQHRHHDQSDMVSLSVFLLLLSIQVNCLFYNCPELFKSYKIKESITFSSGSVYVCMLLSEWLWLCYSLTIVVKFRKLSIMRPVNGQIFFETIWLHPWTLNSLKFTITVRKSIFYTADTQRWV